MAYSVMVSSVAVVTVVHSGCEHRIHRVVKESSADIVEPFQTKMTHFVAKGKLLVFFIFV